MSIKFYSRPRDRSLQAFKDWIQGMTYRLNPNAENTITTKQWIDEKRWIDNWKKFWAKVDNPPKSH
jgi:hypothetical protein